MIEPTQIEEERVKQPDNNEIDYSYDSGDDDEYDEYAQQVASFIQQESRRDDMISHAIDAYHDPWYRTDIFRPHISVWIAWYEHGGDMSQHQADYDRRQRKRALDRARAKYVKR